MCLGLKNNDSNKPEKLCIHTYKIMFLHPKNDSLDPKNDVFKPAK